MRRWPTPSPGKTLVWKTTLTEFARWWRWRLDRRWTLNIAPDDRIAIQFEAADRRYPLAVEIVRGDHVATVPITDPSHRFPRAGLVYEHRAVRRDRPQPTAIRPPRGLKQSIRAALDWETVTPVAEITTGTLTGRIKRQLRRWQDG